MLNLLRKEWIVTRWVHILGAVLGLSLIPMGLMMAKSAPFVAVFSQLIYSHMLFSTNRQTANSRPDNVLNSLPSTRRQIVDGKYLFVAQRGAVRHVPVPADGGGGLGVLHADCADGRCWRPWGCITCC